MDGSDDVLGEDDCGFGEGKIGEMHDSAPSPELLQDVKKRLYFLQPETQKMVAEWVHAREQAARLAESQWWATGIDPRSKFAPMGAERIRSLAQPAVEPPVCFHGIPFTRACEGCGREAEPPYHTQFCTGEGCPECKRLELNTDPPNEHVPKAEHVHTPE